MNSESCLLREEGQMVLCKVDSVVSSGEMNGFRQTSRHLSHSHSHSRQPLAAEHSRAGAVCEDVHDILEAIEPRPFKGIL